MVREGTRSQTGNARPRVFETVDTQPTIKRTKPAGAGRKKATVAAPATKTTGTGVTKKKSPAKKAGGAAGKAKVTANKVTKKAAGVVKAAKK